MTTPLLLLRPDGARVRTERLTFSTDISTALDGSERRVSLRAYPRHAYTAQFTFMGESGETPRDLLRYAERVGFPLTQHQLERNATAADAGVAASGPLLVVNKDGTTVLRPQGTDLSGYWPSASYIAPYAEGWVDLSRTISHKGGTTSAVVLTFDLDDADEAIAPWAGTTVNGKPVWPVRADWSTKPSERIELTADVADYGHLRLREVRYAKRTVGVSLLLRGRAAVLDFRRLVFSLRGACLPFRFTFAPDAAEKSWRLASDEVSIDYYKTSLARVELEFTEVNE